MTEHDAIEIRMMTVAIGQSIGYGEIAEAKRIQRIMMDWVSAPDEQSRRSIYHAFRNDGKSAPGIESS